MSKDEIKKSRDSSKELEILVEILLLMVVDKSRHKEVSNLGENKIRNNVPYSELISVSSSSISCDILKRKTKKVRVTVSAIALLLIEVS